jgi:hypothetical protein
MAAFSLEAQNAVWQKVNTALANASPGAKAIFKALKMWLATQKNAGNLQFLQFDGTSSSGPAHANGVVLATGTATVYGIYGVKPDEGTDSYLVLFDDATDDAGAGTDGRVVLPFLIANPTALTFGYDEALFISPQGVALADGAVVKTYTDFDGTTDSSVTASPSGFVIVGA